VKTFLEAIDLKDGYRAKMDGFPPRMVVWRQEHGNPIAYGLDVSRNVKKKREV